jgi:hypothetical protein
MNITPTIPPTVHSRIKSVCRSFIMLETLAAIRQMVLIVLKKKAPQGAGPSLEGTPSSTAGKQKDHIRQHEASMANMIP